MNDSYENIRCKTCIYINDYRGYCLSCVSMRRYIKRTGFRVIQKCEKEEEPGIHGGEIHEKALHNKGTLFM